MNLAPCLMSLLALCSLSPLARADRFHLGAESTAEKMVEGEPDVLVGVLLGEEGGFYVIRIEGGEVRIPKASVRKIEKDDLSADAIAEREAEQSAYLAEANALRADMVAAEASARRSRVRDTRAMEASAVREAGAPLPAPALGPVYDPILHVSYPAGANTYLVQKELGGVIRRQIQKETREELKRR
jgi:hypothetical protein